MLTVRHRPALLAAPVVLLLAVVLVVHVVDRGRNARAYGAVLEVRELGAAAFSLYADAFKDVGPGEVRRYATDSHFVPALTARMERASRWPAPVLFGRAASAEARRQATAWTQLLAEPRGTWPMYIGDVATTRRALDDAVRGLEPWAAPSPGGAQRDAEATARTAALEVQDAIEADRQKTLEGALSSVSAILAPYQQNRARAAEESALQERIRQEAAAFEAKRAAERAQERKEGIR